MAQSTRPKDPLGIQLVTQTPPFAGIASSTFQEVETEVLARGTWLVNINQIELTSDDYPTVKMNSVRQQILYGAVVKDVSAFIGDSAGFFGAQLSSVAVIICDGVTPVTIRVYGVTADNTTTYSADAGTVTYTRLF